MNVEKIDKLEQLIPLEENKTIVGHKVTRLTAAGENYGSLMLAVDITVQNAFGTEEINAIAKMVPPNDFIQEVFNTQSTFKTEIGFYNNIVPTLHNFQKEQGMDDLIDFFPKYYGSRINLSGDPDKVNSDAVLLLENLKFSGYKNFERTLGFDLETSKLIIADLAQLHATPLALKLTKPDVFEKEIKKYLKPLPHKDEPPNFSKTLFSVLDTIDEIRIYKPRVKKQFESIAFREKSPREPFATLTHNDCWVNNTMVKVEKGKSVKNKLVDFQLCNYGSPATDLLFFLFSSVQNHVMEHHCESLIRYYHQIFVSVLQGLKCDTSRFSFQAFMKEIEEEASSEFGHAMFFTFIIFAEKGTVKELTELTPEDIIPQNSKVSDAHKEKLAFIIKQFAKRNWI